ncbi:UDP-3-O-acyl N-acetylglucosamine deacetylase [Elusimicrobium minutum Pei191]|uniref:UDP-3-O-acyl-N-acetylglucosamine deacetylase n=1 Tax=Elusimicrobium minutum (strain Pei191) TaxID=445932 RepID=B2KAU7_ELUMP|nr:UDP-3-O-acyl-N-acetylglucosamine deacetylase [Elusimicrobium minutum]ACC97643.1 UDP-3-O-acyl N-acetylglucosamine deacetylase [Elusimicrobium minutum Pei191]
MFRQTIAERKLVKGIGLHTGRDCTMTFEPYDREGIYFLRTDIKDSKPIKAFVGNVSSTMRGTNLTYEGAEVHTVEHVLSACSALGITDILISMDGPEPPVMDGSSQEYSKVLILAGIKRLDKKVPVLTINKKIEMSENNVLYTAEPADKLTMTFLFVHTHPLVSRLEHTLEFSKDNYLKEIGPARTFGFVEELEFLKKHGLAKGGSTENAVVITKDGFSSPLRFEGEMVRHKILDMIGDFALTGCILDNMKIYARGGGHKFNVEFAKKLLKEGVING